MNKNIYLLLLGLFLISRHVEVQKGIEVNYGFKIGANFSKYTPVFRV